MYRVLIYDRELKKKLYAYGEDGRELRFKTMEEASNAVHPMVGAEKRWPCLYVIEQAPKGPAPMVIETVAAPRFRRLAGERKTFHRMGWLSRSEIARRTTQG